MKLLFLGSGSAFTLNGNYHSNMLFLADNGNKLLIDCGSDARLSLKEQGYSYHDINHVYISHLHADHVGGLEWLGFTHRFDPSCDKPNLYLHSSLADKLWEHVLAGGMNSIQGEISSLDSYFQSHLIEDNSGFVWESIHFQLIQVVHVTSGRTINPSFGLIFNYEGKNIFITTDTQFIPKQLLHFYSVSDLVFHDCETAPYRSGIHAHYTELKKVDKDFKKKMWLYHYNPGKLPPAKKDGFQGFVKKGHLFDLDDPHLYVA